MQYMGQELHWVKNLLRVHSPACALPQTQFPDSSSRSKSTEKFGRISVSISTGKRNTYREFCGTDTNGLNAMSLWYLMGINVRVRSEIACDSARAHLEYCKIHIQSPPGDMRGTESVFSSADGHLSLCRNSNAFVIVANSNANSNGRECL